MTFGVILSGCAGLIYEILWIRQLTEVFGHTTLAVSVVTAAFMAGLALGGAAADSLVAGGGGRLLRIYALCEAALAVFGWFSRDILRRLEPFASASVGIGWFPIVLLALGPPTFLMGLTLPLLVAHGSDQDFSDQVLGHFYGFNTLGAALGCLLGGLWLPPRIGITATLRLAAGLNAAAMAAALLAEEKQIAPDPRTNAVTRGPSLLVLLLAFISGLAAFLCEVAWFRCLQLLMGSSIHTISLILFCLLSGIALGGIFYRRFAARLGGVAGWVWIELALGLALWAGLASYERLFFLEASWSAWIQSTLTSRLLAHALFGIILIGPAAVFMGLSLPCLWAAFSHGGAGRAEIGSFYCANTAGSVAGSLLGAFVLLPAYGPERTLTAALLLNVGMAALVALGYRESGKRVLPAAMAGLIVVMALLRPAWDKNLISSGLFVTGLGYSGVSGLKELRERLKPARLRYYADGISATVSVKEYPDGKRSLQVNGKTDASSNLDLLTQMLLGYVPLMLRWNASDVLVIGLGSGVTAGTLGLSPAVKSIEVVEIEPRVREAAAFFSVENHGVLSDPRLSLVTADARHHLRVGARRYDIIVSEPSNPWISGIASLYTREHFFNVREHLSSKGVFCQWFHSYSMSEKDFRMVLETFSAVFPEVMLFRGGSTSDYLLLGSMAPWSADRRSIEEAVSGTAAIGDDLSRFRLAGALPLLGGSYVLEGADWRRYSQGAPFNTDDRPLLEFSASRNLYRNEEMAIYRSLENARGSELPSFLRQGRKLEAGLLAEIGAASLSLRDFPRAYRLLDEAVRRNPTDPRANLDFARLLDRIGFQRESERRLLSTAAKTPRFSEAFFYLGDLYARRGEAEKAIPWFQRGLSLEPDNSRANLSLGTLYLRLGKIKDARAVFERGLRSPRMDEQTRFLLREKIKSLR